MFNTAPLDEVKFNSGHSQSVLPANVHKVYILLKADLEHSHLALRDALHCSWHSHGGSLHLNNLIWDIAGQTFRDAL